MENMRLVAVENISEFCKPTFSKIPYRKCEKILFEAKKEFALKGYMGANINDIAKNAGISIGSMYSYFESKEYLFLAVLQSGVDLIKSAIESIDADKYNFYECIERFLKVTREYAIKYPEINQIYIDLSSSAVDNFSNKLSYRIENITKDLYIKVIEKGKREGFIRSNINNEIISYYLDNLIMTYQFSFTSSYWKNRMNILLCEKCANPEEVEKEIVNIIANGLK